MLAHSAWVYTWLIQLWPIRNRHPAAILTAPLVLMLDTAKTYSNGRLPGVVWWVLRYTEMKDQYLTYLALADAKVDVQNFIRWRQWFEHLLSFVAHRWRYSDILMIMEQWPLLSVVCGFVGFAYAVLKMSAHLITPTCRAHSVGYTHEKTVGDSMCLPWGGASWLIATQAGCPQPWDMCTLDHGQTRPRRREEWLGTKRAAQLGDRPMALPTPPDPPNLLIPPFPYPLT